MTHSAMTDDDSIAAAASIMCDMAGSTKQVNAGEAMPGGALTYTIRLELAQRQGQPNRERTVILTDVLPASHQVRFLGWTGNVTGTRDGQTLQWRGRVRVGRAQHQERLRGFGFDVVPLMRQVRLEQQAVPGLEQIDLPFDHVGHPAFQAEHKLISRVDAGRCLAVLDQAERVDRQIARLRQRANGQAALGAQFPQPAADIHLARFLGALPQAPARRLLSSRPSLFSHIMISLVMRGFVTRLYT